nr:glycoside hydrolase [candidate division Zixibacteria bacterium]
MPGDTRLKVAFLWHMHQPFYLNPEDNKFFMPWVRLHGLKDYLDMPLLAAENNIKATFNLVPSLLDQIEMYCRGYTDRHLELSHIPARQLLHEEKREILQTFFMAHYPTMIEPYPRYRQLYRKKDSCGSDINLACEIFSTSELRDLQVWSNLVWIDPMFRNRAPIQDLYEKQRDFTEEEKSQLLGFEIELLKEIIPTYQRLYKEGKIDISFTPYYHPILPLLIDTDSAREAMADIHLPENRFRYPEDATWHIDRAVERYHQLFGGELAGMWPSEGSVSEDALGLISKRGIRWVATDEEILYNSLLKSGLSKRDFSPHQVYSLEGIPGTKMLFRDHGLSDKIGFVYSGWEAERAVSDFIGTIKSIRDFYGDRAGNCVIPIILDGENAWEYFPDDGQDFLRRLYRGLGECNHVEIVSMTEAADCLKPITLPSLFPGSWINHNFRIWIGHNEDNQAWDFLYEARRALVHYEKSHPKADPGKIKAAWEKLYIAEGSDWCWWYGDDHLGAHNSLFDRLFRRHLMAMYRTLELEVPPELMMPIHRARVDSFITPPESLITPRLDGLLTHYYEWTGAGCYDCVKAGGAMHRVELIIKAVYFAFDYDFFYIRLDFDDNFGLVGKNKFRIVLDFKDIGIREIPLEKTVEKDLGQTIFSFKQILEVKIGRKTLTDTGCGRIGFFVLFYSENELMEKWPFGGPITVTLPERDKEIFWQV